MSSEFGNKIKLSIFGESHGEAIGCVIDSIPAGVKLDMKKIYFDTSIASFSRFKYVCQKISDFFIVQFSL